MRQVLGMMWVDRRLLRRDHVGLFFTFLLPLAVAAVLAPIYIAEGGTRASVALVAEGPGPVTELFSDRLGRSPGLELRRYADREAAELAVRRRDVSAAVVLPAGLGEGGTAPDRVELVGPPEVAAPDGVRAAVESAAAETAALVVAARALEPGAALEDGLEVAAGRAGGALDGAAAAAQPAERRNANAASAVIGVVVLFAFVNTMAKSSQLASYRELGVLGRLRAMPVTSTQVALGFALGLAGYAAAQGLLVVAGATLFLGVSWPQPLLVVAFVLVVGLVAGGLSALVGCVLPSSSAGVTIAGPVGFVLAMLGGCLWPLGLVGPAMRAVGHLTPHAWAVDGLNAVVFGWPTGDWVVPLLVLAGFAVALAALAGRALRLAVTA
ncbi:MAG TPA: ABC transporter permease [Acidimicrobiales bacterium]|nr:ABC transporter permease [Acidimicrobiales bacterium]